MDIPLHFIALLYLLSGLSFLFLATGIVGIYNAVRRRKGQ